MKTRSLLAIFYLILSLSFEARIPDISELSLEQKIGQLIIVATVSSPKHNALFMLKSPYNLASDYVECMIKEHHIGGVIYMGTGTPQKQLKHTNRLQDISKIPLLITLDAEWGLSMRLQKDVITFPRAMTLGALSAEHNELIYELGNEIGRQCKTIGVHINFAPVADVNNNPHNPVINIRSFGDDPEKISRKSVLFMHGLQDAGVLACGKHFPGHGDTDIDTHHGRGIVPHDKNRLMQVEIVPFKSLIDNDIAAIMTAHLDAPALSQDEQLPATLSHNILTKLLREQLGFKGLIVSDGLGMKAMTNIFPPGELELKALKAGNDILLCPVNVAKVIARINKAPDSIMKCIVF